MIRTVIRFCAVLLPLALLAVGCGSPAEPSTTTTTTTPTVSVTETFEGTLGSGGTKLHVFHTMPGVFTVTLTSTDPATFSQALSMSFGMWDGKTCTEVLSTLSAASSSALTGTASIETDVCLKMSDPTPWEQGFQLSYKLTTVHFAKSS